MSQQPLVSVIIPAYNASVWIAETILSVLAQDYKDYEIIVIDDGSTDDTAVIVKRFKDKVLYIHKQNGGQSSARNLGIRAARGKYIAFIDADDLWTKDKLRLQVELLESTNRQWVYSDALAFDNQNGNILYKFSEISKQFEGDILKNLYKACFIPMLTTMIHRDVFTTIGLFNENASMRNREDWEMWLRIAANYPVVLIPQILAYYRVHSTSATGNENLTSRMNGLISVIQEAAIRERDRLGPMKNTILSRIYYLFGRLYALRGETIFAQKLFEKSIKLTPGWIYPYISWMIAPITPWVEIQRKKIRLNITKIIRN